MASSSALQLGDLALVWSAAGADIVMIDSDLASERGLVTAALLSLLLDRRAERDDKPPSGDPRDVRGWWADEFLPNLGDRYGSRLWLLDRSVRSNETVLLAKQYIREALQWFLDDKVVSSIDVEVETTTDALVCSVGLQRPGRDPVSFRFAHVWAHVEEDL